MAQYNTTQHSHWRELDDAVVDDGGGPQANAAGLHTLHIKHQIRMNNRIKMLLKRITNAEYTMSCIRTVSYATCPCYPRLNQNRGTHVFRDLIGWRGIARNFTIFLFECNDSWDHVYLRVAHYGAQIPSQRGRQKRVSARFWF